MFAVSEEEEDGYRFDESTPCDEDEEPMHFSSMALAL